MGTFGSYSLFKGGWQHQFHNIHQMNFTLTTDTNALTPSQATDLRTMEPTKCDFSDPNNPVWVRPFDEEKTELRKKFIEMDSVMRTSNDAKKQYIKEISELQENYNNHIIGTEQFFMLHNGIEVKSRVNNIKYQYNTKKNSFLVIDCMCKALEIFLKTIEDFKLIETYKLYDTDWIKNKKEYLYDCIKVLFSTYHKIRKSVLHTYQELSDLLIGLPRLASSTICRNEVKYKQQYLEKIIKKYNLTLHKMNDFSNKIATFPPGIICPIFKCWSNNYMTNNNKTKCYADKTPTIHPNMLKKHKNLKIYNTNFDKEYWSTPNNIDTMLSACQIDNYEHLQKKVRKTQGGNPRPFIEKLEEGDDEWILESSKKIDNNYYIITQRNIVDDSVKYTHATTDSNGKVYTKTVNENGIDKIDLIKNNKGLLKGLHR